MFYSSEIIRLFQNHCGHDCGLIVFTTTLKIILAVVESFSIWSRYTKKCITFIAVEYVWNKKNYICNDTKGNGSNGAKWLLFCGSKHKMIITTDVDNDAVMMVSMVDDVNCISNESEHVVRHTKEFWFHSINLNAIFVDSLTHTKKEKQHTNARMKL